MGSLGVSALDDPAVPLGAGNAGTFEVSHQQSQDAAPLSALVVRPGSIHLGGSLDQSVCVIGFA